MKLYSVLAGTFKLDGGAMFGVVPKTIWNQSGIADEKNLVTLAMRCLLIQSEDKTILIDTGIGNKLPTKIAAYYYIDETISLERSLQNLGFQLEDIDHVVLSHLHLDHAGGAIQIKQNGDTAPTFPNATYWVSKTQWDWATKNVNPREKASFIPENLLPIEQHKCLKFIPKEGSFLLSSMQVKLSDGHTRGMAMPVITGKKKILFAADLLPSIAHIPTAYIPAYDIDPLTSMKEKTTLFQEAIENEYVIFLDHDPNYECCTLQQSEKGIQLKKAFTLNSVIDSAP